MTPTPRAMMKPNGVVNPRVPEIAFKIGRPPTNEGSAATARKGTTDPTPASSTRSLDRSWGSKRAQRERITTDFCPSLGLSSSVPSRTGMTHTCSLGQWRLYQGDWKDEGTKTVQR